MLDFGKFYVVCCILVHFGVLGFCCFLLILCFGFAGFVYFGFPLFSVVLCCMAFPDLLYLLFGGLPCFSAFLGMLWGLCFWFWVACWFGGDDCG